MIRLFIALAIPPDVSSCLSLLSGGIPGARWMPEENYHITLHFIGEVEEPALEAVDMALGVVRADAFELLLQGVGQFGGDNVHALWVGVPSIPGLLQLKTKIDGALMRQGIDGDRRKYTPHVTLARLKKAPKDKVIRFLTDHALFQAGPMTVTRFTLYSSHTGGESPVYTPLKHYALLTGK